MKRDGLLSVVVPAYNEKNNVPAFVAALSGLLSGTGIEYEIIFVDDGSHDGTWDAILSENKKDARVRGISFVKNFGKDSALFAGLSYMRGDCAVTIDCDLQHPPALIPEMYALWSEGAAIVEGVKNTRGDEGTVKGLCARVFYSVLSALCRCDMRDASDYKLLDRGAVKKILSRKTAFYRAAPACAGIKGEKVFFDVARRTDGQSKWSVWKLFKYTLFAFFSVLLPFGRKKYEIQSIIDN